MDKEAEGVGRRKCAAKGSQAVERWEKLHAIIFVVFQATLAAVCSRKSGDNSWQWLIHVTRMVVPHQK